MNSVNAASVGFMSVPYILNLQRENNEGRTIPKIAIKILLFFVGLS